MDGKIIKYTVIFLFICFNASAIEFTGKFIQGHFILGKTETNSKIIIDKKEIKVSKDGYFVFGIDRDRKFDILITKISNGKKEKIVDIDKDILIEDDSGLTEETSSIIKNVKYLL